MHSNDVVADNFDTSDIFGLSAKAFKITNITKITRLTKPALSGPDMSVVCVWDWLTLCAVMGPKFIVGCHLAISAFNLDSKLESTFRLELTVFRKLVLNVCQFLQDCEERE